MEARDALAAWRRSGPLQDADDGLINRTWLVGPTDSPPQAVLQWVNPIFDARVHDDIEAVTAWLARKGLPTPRLLRTPDGALSVADDQRGRWRLYSFVPGRTLHRLRDPAMAHQAGALVGRFHAAMADWPGAFVAPRRNVHDTPARMADLRAALDAADGHPLEGPARAVGQSLLDAWARWEGRLDLPERPAHGDLKISNLRFAADGPEAVCLLDLDTLGPLPLAVELGDAWRSWCNPAGESEPEAATFDEELFAASAQGWLAEGPRLDAAELADLVPGIERICLELAARFCADAVRNGYFREDRDRWPQPGAHNLVRARTQLHLAGSARAAAVRCQQRVQALHARRRD
ncbi:phosphotransferase [Myxococcota bacterium]|nr:phosphotransferase [Myxococcota bacterium]